MKNYRMQFWRIIFTYLIALYHFNNAYNLNTGWYIAVEFFFILSGYLLTAKFEKQSVSHNGTAEPSAYLVEKWKSYYPHYIFSFFVVFFGYGFLNHYNISKYVRSFVKHLDEILLVQCFGWNKPTSDYFNSPTWYISTLLIVGYLIWYMLKNHKKAFVQLLCPMAIILIYAYFYRTYGDVREHRETLGFFLNSALMRGFAAMSLGVLAYYAAQRIRELLKDNKYLVMLNIVSDVLFCVVIISSFFCYSTGLDFIYIPFLWFGIVTAFADNRNPKYFNNRMVSGLALISFPIFLNHKFFRKVFHSFYGTLNWQIYVLYLVVITLYSICTYFIVNKGKVLFSHLWNRMVEK